VRAADFSTAAHRPAYVFVYDRSGGTMNDMGLDGKNVVSWTG
jgi:hypothetical protein